MTIALRLPDGQAGDARATSLSRSADGRTDAPRSGQGFDTVLAQVGGAPPTTAAGAGPAAAASPKAGLVKGGDPSPDASATPGPNVVSDAASSSRSDPAVTGLPIMTHALPTALAPATSPPAPRAGVDVDLTQDFAQQIASAATPATGDAAVSAQENTGTEDAARKDAVGSGGQTLDPALLAMALAASGIAPAPGAPNGSGALANASSSAPPTRAASATTTVTTGTPPLPTDAARTPITEPPLTVTMAVATHLDPTPTSPDGHPAPGDAAAIKSPSSGTLAPDAASRTPTPASPAAPHLAVTPDATSTDVAAPSERPRTAETTPTTTLVMPPSLTPTQAVARAIAVAAPPAPTPTTAEPSTPVPSAPPRTMVLQLTPASLGTVTVTMHLAAGGLDLSLGASDVTTGATLRRDKDILASAVQSQGYTLHSLTVQGTDAGGATSGDGGFARQDGGGQTFSQAGDPSQNTGRGHTPSGEGRAGGRNDAAPSRSSRTDHEPAPRTSAAAGTLYL